MYVHVIYRNMLICKYILNFNLNGIVVIQDDEPSNEFY